jgi:hypothetical protein
MAEELLSLDAPLIRTWAVAVSSFEEVRLQIADRGYGEHVIDMSRRRPDGLELTWQILFVSGHGFGQSMPFFIDWQESPHPSRDAPSGLSLNAFIVSHPEGDELKSFFDAFGLAVKIETGAPVMQARISSPRGELLLG